MAICRIVIKQDFKYSNQNQQNQRTSIMKTKLTFTLLAIVVGLTISSCRYERYDCNVAGYTQCERAVPFFG